MNSNILSAPTPGQPIGHQAEEITSAMPPLSSITIT